MQCQEDDTIFTCTYYLKSANAIKSLKTVIKAKTTVASNN